MITPTQLYDIADNVWQHRIRGHHPEIEKDDAIQEAVMRAWRNRSKFNPKVAKEVTFFSTVIRNEFHQHAKVARNRCSMTITDVMAEHLPFSQVGVYCDEPDPLTVMIQQEDRDDLQRAIDDLPRDAQLLIELRMEETTLRDIAELFGVSYKAISMRYSRAVDQLRATLGTQ